MRPKNSHLHAIATIVVLAWLLVGPTAEAAGQALVSAWGGEGEREGQFDTPAGVATGAAGFVYVADSDNNRVQKFDPTGGFVLMWGSGVRDGTEVLQTCTGYCHEGMWGDDDGQFDSPGDVAIDAAGFVYVADTLNDRIQKFDSNGNLVAVWGSTGSDEGQLDFPVGVATDAAGYVYIADSDNNRVQKFDSWGRFVLMWGWGVQDGLSTFQICTSSCRMGGWGDGTGQFDSPTGITTDKDGFVYVADTLNDRIQKFDSNGNFVASWGRTGSDEGQLDYPVGMATDAAGYVYVADSDNNRVQQFTSGGSFANEWGSRGSKGGQFSDPVGVATDAAGSVYVADSDNNRIQKFTAGPDSHPGFPREPRKDSSDTNAPKISKLSVTNRRFRVSGKRVKVPHEKSRASRRRINKSSRRPMAFGKRLGAWRMERKEGRMRVKRRAKRGTKFKYTISEDARVIFTIKRVKSGRRVGKRCKRTTGRLPKRRRCKRYKTVGSFTRKGKAGRNSKKFLGKIGRKRLRVGHYRTWVKAVDDAGNSSKTRRVGFQVVRG